jgi:Outer membrane protein beta-barrel domain
MAWWYRSRLACVVTIIVAMTGLSSAFADDLYDISLSGFAGFAIPLTTTVNQTNATQSTNFTAQDVKLDSSGSYGMKLTAWTTALRPKNGFDLGIELDHTRFSADTRAQTASAGGVSQGVAVQSAFVNKNEVGIRSIAVNALFRIPYGVTEALPHGRWYPYVGVGGGVQRATMRLTDGSEDSNSALLVQGLAGIKIFIVKHVAIFGEYKFTYADHSFVFDATRNETIQAHHMTFGVALHF